MHLIITRAALAAVLASSLAHGASAHAHLRNCVPAVGSTGAAPAELSCAFTEALEPDFTTVVLHDAGGKPVTTGALHLAAGDAKRVVVGLPALPAGTYTVIWHATSVDTHKTEGSFTFTVAP